MGIRGETSRDINRCEEIINAGDEATATKEAIRLVIAYGSYLPNLKERFDFETGGYDYTASCIEDIRLIQGALKIFKANGCELPKLIQGRSPLVELNNNNSIQNYINISFDEVRKNIASSGILPQEEIDDILERINELEEISQGSDTRNKKWSKMKGLLSWLGDKGVDVAVQFLPLILKSFGT